MNEELYRAACSSQIQNALFQYLYALADEVGSVQFLNPVGGDSLNSYCHGVADGVIEAARKIVRDPR